MTADPRLPQSEQEPSLEEALEFVRWPEPERSKILSEPEEREALALTPEEEAELRRDPDIFWVDRLVSRDELVDRLLATLDAARAGVTFRPASPQWWIDIPHEPGGPAVIRECRGCHRRWLADEGPVHDRGCVVADFLVARPASPDSGALREALKGLAFYENSDGTPCWCNQDIGHSRECAAAHAALAASPQSAPESAPAGTDTPPDSVGLDVHPGENHEFRTTCLRCGEPGYLHVAVITPGETVRIEPLATDAASVGTEER